MKLAVQEPHIDPVKAAHAHSRAAQLGTHMASSKWFLGRSLIFMATNVNKTGHRGRSLRITV